MILDSMPGFYEYTPKDWPFLIFVDYDPEEDVPTKTYSEMYRPTEKDVVAFCYKYDLDPVLLLNTIKTRRPDVHLVVLDIPVYRKG